MSGSTKRPAESIDVEEGFKEIGCMGRTFRVKWNGGKVQPPGPNCSRFIHPESFKNHVRYHCGECWGMGTEGKPFKILRAALATDSQSENDAGRFAGQSEFAEKSDDQPNLSSESNTPEDDAKPDANKSQTKNVEEFEEVEKGQSGERRISGTVTVKHSHAFSFEFEVVTKDPVVDPQLREKIKEAVTEGIIRFYGGQTLSKTETNVSFVQISNPEDAVPEFVRSDSFNNGTRQQWDDTILTTLDKTRPHADPIPKYLLPFDATLFKRVVPKNSLQGHEYMVPLNTDYKAWIEWYGQATGAKFLRRSSRPSSATGERVEYFCNRGGKYMSKAGENPNVKARITQKQSIKVDCKARIIVTRDGVSMLIKIVGHTGHELGTIEDIGKMRLSREVRNFIADRIIEGLDVKGVKAIFKKRQRSFRNLIQNQDKTEFTYQGVRDSMVTSDDIYNIWKEVVSGDLLLHEDESKSIKLWQERMSRESHLACSVGKETPAEKDLGYMIGFIVPGNKALLQECEILLLDATHGTNKHDFYLFTLLSSDPMTGRGVPLAHLISSSKHATTIAHWLRELQKLLSNWNGPRSFVVDCDKAQITAIQSVFPQSQVFLCWFHVARAWKYNLRRANEDIAHLEGATKDELVNNLWIDLQTLLHSKTMHDSLDNIESFSQKYALTLKSFWEYFRSQWLDLGPNGIHAGMWQEAYRADIPFSMNTTNMLESWHRKLKYDTFNGKPNRRCDVLIHHLYVQGADDARHQRIRAKTGAGRMCPAQRSKRRREIELERVGATTKDDRLAQQSRLKRAWLLVSSNDVIENGDLYGHSAITYTVHSATDKDTRYTVEWDPTQDPIHTMSSTEFYSCSCPDYRFRNVTCKHIFAVMLRFDNRLVTKPMQVQKGLPVVQPRPQEQGPLPEAQIHPGVQEQEAHQPETQVLPTAQVLPGLQGQEGHQPEAQAPLMSQEITVDEKTKKIDSMIQSLRSSLIDNVVNLDVSNLPNVENLVSNSVQDVASKAPFDPSGWAKRQGEQLPPNMKNKRQRR